jgi:hypothetical protein
MLLVSWNSSSDIRSGFISVCAGKLAIPDPDILHSTDQYSDASAFRPIAWPALYCLQQECLRLLNQDRDTIVTRQKGGRSSRRDLVHWSRSSCHDLASVLTMLSCITPDPLNRKGKKARGTKQVLPLPRIRCLDASSSSRRGCVALFGFERNQMEQNHASDQGWPC